MDCAFSVDCSLSDISTTCNVQSNLSDTCSLRSSCETQKIWDPDKITYTFNQEVTCDDEENMSSIVPRGWSMRRGHLKKLQRPKRGKAALWAEIQGQGQEVSRGRSVFKRSVNSGQNWKSDWEYSKAKAKRELRHNSLRDACELQEDWHSQDDWYWNDEDEEDEEWSPNHGWWEPHSPKAPEVPADEKLCLRLSQFGAKYDYKALNAAALGRQLQPFECVQRNFLHTHGARFCKELSRHMGAMQVRPAPVSEIVQSRFLDARKELRGTLRAAYHGTDVCNFNSIYQSGLLVPGHGNGVRVVNGSAHGVGIYTAKLDNPSLSWGFCRAPAQTHKKMMICGVLDDATGGSGFTQYTMGFRSVTSESENVRHVGSAMVIFDHRRVAPLFEVSCRAMEKKLPPVTTVYFNWSRHACLVQRMKDLDESMPPKYHRYRPRQAKPCSSTRPKTLEDFAGRRAARKRRSKGL